MTGKYTETVFSSQGKKGILKCDEDGYYTVVLGALNTYNSVDEFYTAQKAIDLFNNSSAFQRRVQKGALYAELGHPKKAPSMSLDDFYRRIFSIEETNICAHISEVWLDHDFGKKNPQKKNPNIIAIMGKVRPAGPHAETARIAFENPKQNPAFSIRSITDNVMRNGRLEKTLTSVITFDFVVEPGIHIAQKDQNPALESNSVDFLVEDVTSHTINRSVMGKVLASQMKHASMESSRLLFDDISKKLKLNQTKAKSIFDW